MSTITEDVGCYDFLDYYGNTSRKHPPGVKLPDDTTALVTSRLQGGRVLLHSRLCVTWARRKDGTRDCLDGTDEWFGCN
ncbi:hypothetical protein DPMN_147056 [Dreissena polymorpha]|uniref:Uncharacterized protein n=1 Tax=Dreissena polymorpha TaxID=45954 RepID=A0A9D4F8A3_DREPO|nr:hypothetical protein DPMN_147056 [Dreissena polymorpha]